MLELIPTDWSAVLAESLADPRLERLEACVAAERASYDVYPSPEDVFRAIRETPYSTVRAVIIGQDPYHQPGQADGLAFSVRPGVPAPPSLRNVLHELGEDLERPTPATASLDEWAQRGILLLNSVLTVRRGEPGSHTKCGWLVLTGAIVRAVDASPGPIVFLLWEDGRNNAGARSTGADTWSSSLPTRRRCRRTADS